MKKLIILSLLLAAVAILASCAVPFSTESLPSSSPINIHSSSKPTTADFTKDETVEELQTFSAEEQITNFKVLSTEEKSEQIRVRENDPLSPLPIVEWKKTAQYCPYTSQEILDLISLGDTLDEMYEKIGYPTYRDRLDTPLNRGTDLRFMSYQGADGCTVAIMTLLAGCCEADYRYIITGIVAHTDPAGEDAIFEHMDDKTMIATEIIPLFIAVEQKGVDYLLENDLITPYEATLYAAEEAVFQASLAAKEVQEQANE